MVESNRASSVLAQTTYPICKHIDKSPESCSNQNLPKSYFKMKVLKSHLSDEINKVVKECFDDFCYKFNHRYFGDRFAIAMFDNY